MVRKSRFNLDEPPPDQMGGFGMATPQTPVCNWSPEEIAAKKRRVMELAANMARKYYGTTGFGREQCACDRVHTPNHFNLTNVFN